MAQQLFLMRDFQGTVVSMATRNAHERATGSRAPNGECGCGEP
jgi:hypothetical protein